jgi:hypothetical protein
MVLPLSQKQSKINASLIAPCEFYNYFEDPELTTILSSSVIAFVTTSWMEAESEVVTTPSQHHGHQLYVYTAYYGNNVLLGVFPSLFGRGFRT